MTGSADHILSVLDQAHEGKRRHQISFLVTTQLHETIKQAALSRGKAMKARHSWGAKTTFPYKTERVCEHCGLVKVTRHEPSVLPWIEWWRGLEKVGVGRTPECVEEPELAEIRAVEEEAAQ